MSRKDTNIDLSVHFGDVCDYAICGDKGGYLKSHEQYVDESGYIRIK